MSSSSGIRDLMAQIGPMLDLLQVTEYEEEKCWLLVMDPETGVDVEYDEPNQRLVITMEVGEAKEETRLKTYEALLRYNYLWTEHGGVRAALDGDPGKIVLMLEVAAADLDLPKLCSILQTFREITEGWRTALRSAGSSETATEEFAPPPFGTMIRA